MTEQAPMKRLLLSWYDPVCDAITTAQAEMKQGALNDSVSTIIEASRRIHHNQRTPSVSFEAKLNQAIGEKIQAVGAPELTCIVMHEALNLLVSSGGEVPLVHVAIAVGNAVKNEIALGRLRQDKTTWSKVKNQPTSKLIPMLNAREQFAAAGGDWDDATVVEVGVFLISILVRTAKVSKRHVNPNAIGTNTLRLLCLLACSLGFVFTSVSMFCTRAFRKSNSAGGRRGRLSSKKRLQ